MSKINLKSATRKITGRKVKRLRKEGRLPANLYGPDIKSVAIVIDTKEFASVFAQAGETSVVDLAVDKKVYPVLIHNIQYDPVSMDPLHVDFLKIDLKKKVTTNIPLEVVGESPAVKQGLGTLVSYIDEVEVEALPGDLVEKIDVNVEGLVEADQSLSIKDLLYDKNKLTITNDPEAIVVKIEVQKEELVEEVKTEEEEAVEGETKEEGEGAPAEGKEDRRSGGTSGPEEKPAEGETPKEESSKKE